MQLIWMAMSEGDQGKKGGKNRNRRPSSAAGDHQTTREPQSQEYTQQDNGSHIQQQFQYPATSEYTTLHTDITDNMGRSLPQTMDTSPSSVIAPISSSSSHSVSQLLPRAADHDSPTLSVVMIRRFTGEPTDHSEDQSEEGASEQEGSSSCSHTEMSVEGCYMASQDEIHSGSPSHTQDRLSPSKERSSEMKSDSHDVDENMNITGMKNNNLLPLESALSVPQADSEFECTSARSNKRDDVEFEEHSASGHTLLASSQNSPRPTYLPFSNNNTNTCIPDKSKLKLALVTDNNEPPDLATSNHVSPTSSQLVGQLEAVTPEPPLWTPLALRDYITRYADIVYPLAQPTSNHAAVVRSNMLPLPFQPVIGVADSEVTSHHLDHLSHDMDGASDIGVPECYVFQTCHMDNVEHMPHACINESVNGDSFRQQCDGSNNMSPESDIGSCEGNGRYMLALNDIDCFLRMLPTVCDDNDMIVNHLIDSEVARMTDNNEEDEVDEELVSFGFHSAFDVASVSRPSNPVAQILEHGGDEHFQPLISDGFQDRMMQD